MQSPAKKINKWLIGFIIGGTVLGISGLSSTEKGKGLLGRCLKTFVDRGRGLLDTTERLGTKLAQNADKKDTEKTP